VNSQVYADAGMSRADRADERCNRYRATHEHFLEHQRLLPPTLGPAARGPRGPHELRPWPAFCQYDAARTAGVYISAGLGAW